MLTRLVMIGLACLMSVSMVQAESTIHFRGKLLTYRHFVYGVVNSAARSAGTINLGFAHGMQPGQAVGVLRRSGGNLIPIGVIELKEVRPGEAFGRYDGDFPLAQEDVVIVSARELNLWQGRSRSNQLVIDSLLSQNGRSYDTGAVSPGLLNEVGRDDDLIVHRPFLLHVNSDLYAMRRPFVRDKVVRGAFRLAPDSEGTTKLLSAEDRNLSPDTATLDLETALARFVASNRDGKIIVDPETLRQLAHDQPGLVDPDDLKVDLERANSRVRQLIQPK